MAVIMILSVHRGEARLMTIEQAQAWQKEWKKEAIIQAKSNDFDHSNDQATIALLQKITLQGVVWGNQDIQWVLNDIVARIEKADPKSTPLKFVVQMPGDAHQVDVVGRLVNRNVCIGVYDKTSLFNLLCDIGRQTNLSFKVEKNQVVFMQWKPGNFVSLPIDEPM